MKSDSSLPAMASSGKNFDFINKHRKSQLKPRSKKKKGESRFPLEQEKTTAKPTIETPETAELDWKVAWG